MPLVFICFIVPIAKQIDKARKHRKGQKSSVDLAWHLPYSFRQWKHVQYFLYGSHREARAAPKRINKDKFWAGAGASDKQAPYRITT